MDNIKIFSIYSVLLDLCYCWSTFWGVPCRSFVDLTLSRIMIIEMLLLGRHVSIGLPYLWGYQLLYFANPNRYSLHAFLQTFQAQFFLASEISWLFLWARGVSPQFILSLSLSHTHTHKSITSTSWSLNMRTMEGHMCIGIDTIRQPS